MPSPLERVQPVRRAFLVGLALCVAVIFPIDVAGQGLSVGPVRIAMTADQPSASVEVRSGDFASSILVQATAFTWTEANGNRELVPTEELVVTPAVFKLEPGGVRTLVLNASVSGAVPRYYRLRVEEVADEAQSPEAGVQLEMLRAFDLPVFVEAQGARAELRAEAIIDELAGEARIRLHNAGNAYAVGTAARLRETGATVSELAGLFYVLPGESRDIILSLSEGSASPNTEDGDGDVPLVLGAGALEGLTFEVEGALGEILVEGAVARADEEKRPSNR